MNRTNQKDHEPVHWVYNGLGFGLVFFAGMLALDYFRHRSTLSWSDLLPDFLICMIGGLVYGYVTEIINRFRAKRARRHAPPESRS